MLYSSFFGAIPKVNHRTVRHPNAAIAVKGLNAFLLV